MCAVLQRNKTSFAHNTSQHDPTRDLDIHHFLFEGFFGEIAVTRVQLRRKIRTLESVRVRGAPPSQFD